MCGQGPATGQRRDLGGGQCSPVSCQEKGGPGTTRVALVRLGSGDPGRGGKVGHAGFSGSAVESLTCVVPTRSTGPGEAPLPAGEVW